MSKQITLWIATGNKGKVREFQLLLPEFGLKIPPPLYPAPEETGSSFKENAQIKARAFKNFLKQQNNLTPGAWVLGEDSGLETTALQGAPGIYSARYAGGRGLSCDEDNNKKLLSALENTPPKDRTGRFVCHIIVLSPLGEELSCRGIVEGFIASRQTYRAGLTGVWPKNWPRFGYDPIFIPKGETRTFFELGADYKNRHSHRFHAVQKLKLLLKAHANQVKKSV